jgi:hypothetical protein
MTAATQSDPYLLVLTPITSNIYRESWDMGNPTLQMQGEGKSPVSPPNGEPSAEKEKILE